MSNLQDPRVLLALERTLLAWNRSSLALMAFGFVIEKSTLLAQLINPQMFAHKIVFNRWLGLAIVAFAVILSFWSMLQYRIAYKSLQPAELIENYSAYPPLWLNILTCFAGVLMIISFWI